MFRSRAVFWKLKQKKINIVERKTSLSIEILVRIIISIYFLFLIHWLNYDFWLVNSKTFFVRLLLNCLCSQQTWYWKILKRNKEISKEFAKPFQVQLTVEFWLLRFPTNQNWSTGNIFQLFGKNSDVFQNWMIHLSMSSESFSCVTITSEKLVSAFSTCSKLYLDSVDMILEHSEKRWNIVHVFMKHFWQTYFWVLIAWACH